MLGLLESLSIGVEYTKQALQGPRGAPQVLFRKFQARNPNIYPIGLPSISQRGIPGNPEILWPGSAGPSRQAQAIQWVPEVLPEVSEVGNRS